MVCYFPQSCGMMGPFSCWFPWSSPSRRTGSARTSGPLFPCGLSSKETHLVGLPSKMVAAFLENTRQTSAGLHVLSDIAKLRVTVGLCMVWISEDMVDWGS